MQTKFNSVWNNTKFKRGSFEPLFYFITITMITVYLYLTKGNTRNGKY